MCRFLILAPVILAACSPTGRGVPINSVDFSDPATVAQLREQLPFDDREAFSNYVLWHHASSSSFCGEPLVDTDGYPPYSVGDAIRLTRIRDAETKAARKAASNSAPDIYEERRILVVQKDTYIDEQAQMRARLGNEAMKSDEWKALDAQIAETNALLKELDEKLASRAAK